MARPVSNSYETWEADRERIPSRDETPYGPRKPGCYSNYVLLDRGKKDERSGTRYKIHQH